MLDSNLEQSFVFRKVVASYGGLKINNIPIGRYRITAKLADGKPLRMSLNKPKDTPFGMIPSQTTDSAIVTFNPSTAKASMVVPQYGNWDTVEIGLERP